VQEDAIREGMEVNSGNEVVCKRSFEVVVKLIRKEATRQQSLPDCSCSHVGRSVGQDLPCIAAGKVSEQALRFFR
jgi:hypothetical protein